jgi:hypothetical protein
VKDKSNHLRSVFDRMLVIAFLAEGPGLGCGTDN